MFATLASRSDLAIRLHHDAAFDEPAPPVVVALPARDEEDHIEACLSALARQRQPAGMEGGFGVLLLANNCRDATVPRAARLLAAAGLPHRVMGISLPDGRASAGFARGLALDVASLWIERSGREGRLLTTDADTLVSPDWLVRNVAGLCGGCGAVAGRFKLDPLEEAALPLHLRQRRRIEAAYEVALLALAARLDPLPHDPWPNHWTASGASFALTLSAYRRIGGQPEVKAGEDRALAAALARHDIPIRHDPKIVVTTSARLDGRASGGCATALRARCEELDMPGDDKLEALPAALGRMVLRRRMRTAFAAGLRADEWERRLALPQGALGDAASSARFGEAWARAEALSPILVPSPLRPSQMALHLTAAWRLLRALDRASTRREKVEPILRRALSGDNVQPPCRRMDEDVGRLVA